MMGRFTFAFLVLFLCAFSYCVVESDEHGLIVAEISNKGLDFVKDLLIQKAESSLVPIDLPEIKEAVHIPLVGNVKVVLSQIVIQTVNLSSSVVEIGDNGVVLYVSGATASISFMWEYSYKAWLLPVSFSDHGSAYVLVNEMDVGLTVSLKALEGSVALSLLDYGCYVNDLSIELTGGASWLYQGLVDSFVGKIESAVEDAVSDTLRNVVVTLNSELKSLPKEVPVAKTAALNVTIVNDPELRQSSIDVEINGLFSPKDDNFLSRSPLVESSNLCDDENKMIRFSVHENVLQSATSVYYAENKMQWSIQHESDQKYLNTKWWRFVLPRLYKTYPNHNMTLDVSVVSVPRIQVKNQQINAEAPLDVVINVIDEEVIPVASISADIRVSASPEISSNSVTGSLRLNGFDLSLNWSNVGDLHIHLLQPLVSAVLRTVVLPYINLKLYEGFTIPDFRGFRLEDAQISCTEEAWIVMCSDVGPAECSPS